MTPNKEKTQQLIHLLSVAPMQQSERTAWLMMIPHMSDEQITKLVDILKADTAEFTEAILKAKN